MSYPRNEPPSCSVEDCGRPSHRSGMCRGHYKRKARGKSAHGPLRLWGDPRRALFEAALALGDVSDDDAEGMRTIRRFWRAFRAAADARARESHKVDTGAQSGAHDQQAASSRLEDAAR